MDGGRGEGVERREGEVFYELYLDVSLREDGKEFGLWRGSNPSFLIFSNWRYLEGRREGGGVLKRHIQDLIKYFELPI